MKIQDIASHLGITAAALADLMGVSKGALNNYTSGRKLKPSMFVSELCAVAKVQREEIYFPDVFDHPDGENPGQPAYWLNIAIEAIRQAEKVGLPESGIALRVFENQLFELGKLTLEEIDPDEI